jgi:hypothetical protein
MAEPVQHFGQSDLVMVSDEDATVALLERVVTGLWEVVNAETVDIIREHRASWRAAQSAAG